MHPFSAEDEAALKELEIEEMPPRRQRAFGRIWLNRAAAVLLILAGTYAFWQYREATRHQAIFAAYYDPLQPDYLNLRGAAAANALSGKPELQAALKLYKDGDYEGSIVFLERHLNDYPQDIQASLLLASALLGEWQPERAIHLLHQLEETDVAAADLYWLLALAHIQNNELGAAERVLNQVKFQDSRAERAAQLEMELNP